MTKDEKLKGKDEIVEDWETEKIDQSDTGSEVCLESKKKSKLL